MLNFIPFGTDGVRGVANEELTPGFAQILGYNAALFFKQKYGEGKIIVGKDTRVSCDMLEHALISGFLSAGVDAESVGVVPTPCVAYLTKWEKAIAGAVISASHNPAIYNGIKFFGPKGFKLSEGEEHEIESLIKREQKKGTSIQIGRSHFNFGAKEEYESHLINCIDIDLKGLKVGIDCANGATYKIAPETIKRLGAKVSVIHDDPDGQNINSDCGSMHLKSIINLVLGEGLDLGLAFDGDGDRVIAVDETGQMIDGDFIMAICASFLKDKNTLKNNSIVVTTMTNLGFDIAMGKRGINVEKSDVGDRYVLEKMLENDVEVGGEQSGHIIFLENTTTGDGLITALRLLEVVKSSDKSLSELKTVMQRLPQKLINVKVNDRSAAMNNKEVLDAEKRINDKLGSDGRLLLRSSGTEPLIRVMVEAETEEEADTTALEMAEVVRKASGGDIV